jgi:hypothetical protein
MSDPSPPGGAPRGHRALAWIARAWRRAAGQDQTVDRRIVRSGPGLGAWRPSGTGTDLAHDGLGLTLVERPGYDGDRYRALIDRQGRDVLGFYVSWQDLGRAAFCRRAPAGTGYCDIVPVHFQGRVDPAVSITVNGVDLAWTDVLEALRAGVAAMEAAGTDGPLYVQVRYLSLGE